MNTDPISPLTGYSRRSFDSLRLRELVAQSQRETFRNGLYLLIALMAALVLLTLVADRFQLDIRLMSAFYKADPGWFLRNQQPWHWLYQYGTLPGLVLAAAGLTGFYLSRTRSRWQNLQRHFLLVILTLIIGPGLLVNAVGKDYWGRPRPEQTQTFGGQWEYRSVFSPGTPGRGKSFPCGHCTMGYAFLTLAVFWKRSLWIACMGSLTALAYGSLLGVARMAAGAHYPTDVLWSLGIVAMVIAVLYYWVLRIPDFHHAPAHRATLTHTGWLALKLSAIGLAILLAFLSRRPYYCSASQTIKLSEQTRQLVVHANVDFTKTIVTYLPGEIPRIVINAKGFAFPKARHSITGTENQSGRIVHLYQDITRKGYYSELNHSCEIFLPLRYQKTLQVDVNGAQ